MERRTYAMKTTHLSFSGIVRSLHTAVILAAAGLSAGTSLQAQIWLPAGAGDFYNPTNWDIATVPGEYYIATINNGGTAILSNTTAPLILGALWLGDGAGDRKSTRLNSSH